MGYVGQQLLKLCGTVPADSDCFRIKIVCNEGETHWLNISVEQLYKIELVLLGGG
jgi:hypothetical protein